MKICQVLSSKGFAGLEKHVLDMCNKLSGYGHDVTLIAEQEYKKYLDENVTLIPLALGGSRYNPVTLFRLATIIRQQKPDIVHAQANKATAMLNIIRRYVPGKLIATLHSLKSNTRMYQHLDHVIAVSQAAAKRVKHTRVSVVYNGIDPVAFVGNKESLYLSDALGSQRTRPVVVAVGRLVKVKGFDVLIDAWRDVDADLVIAGEGKERLSLENRINDLRLNANIHLPGQCDDVPSLMRAADLVVISSRREGFPYVLIEALHVKKPVVSTRVPGSLDLLPVDVLVSCENPEELHKCISNVLKQPNLLNEAFQPLWEYARQNLTVDAMVRKTEKIYHDVLLGN